MGIRVQCKRKQRSFTVCVGAMPCFLEGAHRAAPYSFEGEECDMCLEAEFSLKVADNLDSKTPYTLQNTLI